MPNVIKIPSDAKDLAIKSLLEIISGIRHGSVIGVAVVKTSDDLSVSSSCILEPERAPQHRRA